MRIELICVGTELLCEKLNTNVALIGELLSRNALLLSRCVSVGDDIAEIKEAFIGAANRSDVVLLTGGLGPTFDDLTRDAIAQALGKKLIISQEALLQINAFFTNRGIKDIPKNNQTQAQLIEGAQILTNHLGTAPGQYLEAKIGSGSKEKIVKVVLLPGPPRELLPMFEEVLISKLRPKTKQTKKSFVLRIFGMGESVVDDKIREIINTPQSVPNYIAEFTILAHQMIVDIKATVMGENAQIVESELQRLKKRFVEVLGESIFGQDTQTLQSVVGELLVKKNKTIALAESCTGGLVAYKITSVPGSSAYFKQGFVVYSDEAKQKTLKVNTETLQSYGAVSEQVAIELAEGARELSMCDYAIGITGLAGPDGGSKEKPVGLVYIALCTPNKKEVYKYNFFGNRLDIRERAANAALDILRRDLQSSKP
ncbi:MAG: competence/damage-inducible protein A [Endomicrobiales bacterium]|nr:competence/damage-inducible protein A [Endomicrobiales bacterium]